MELINLVLSGSLSIVCLILSLFLLKYWISLAKKNNLVGKDMNKFDKPLVAESGGIAFMFTLVICLLIYIFFKTFILKSTTNLIGILIIIVSILLAGFIGFIDDILGWKKGLKAWQKILMTLIIAIPLMVINAGNSIINLPFLGEINFGILYPLILIPLGVLGATNGYNILAGYNGLEAGLGLVIFSFLGIIAYQQNLLWLSLIAAIVVFALIGFLFFNKFPAKIFPGDSLTYILGVLLVCFAILGNMQKIALILFIPFIIEGFLKLKSRFKAENFGKVNEDNSLDLPYNKIYSLTHFSIKLLKKIKPSHKVYEKDVVRFLVLIEIILGIIILTIF